MKRKQLLALAGSVCAASLLAFILQDVVRQVVILPLAYAWWLLGLYYRSFPQLILWVMVVVFVLFILLGNLTAEGTGKPREEPKPKSAPGAIENLALAIEKSRRGIYARWQVAHRLGKLARNLLIQRGDCANTQGMSPLTGRDWQPSKPVQNYLDVGLNGSFADYPQPRWPFQRPKPTPLDLDVNEAVEFLESQMERNRNDVRTIHPDD